MFVSYLTLIDQNVRNWERVSFKVVRLVDVTPIPRAGPDLHGLLLPLSGPPELSVHQLAQTARF